VAAETRITAGAWRGRRVLTPRGLAVRPTTSLVREALFNILGERVVDAAVLDLYAGAGTLGFEALSRGAARVVFVERDRRALDLVGQTAASLGCADRCRLIAADVVGWLRRGPEEAVTADIALLDAPYRDEQLEDALRLLGERPPALVVCEHHRSRRLSERFGRLQRVREAGYGATQLTILRREDAAGSGGDRG